MATWIEAKKSLFFAANCRTREDIGLQYNRARWYGPKTGGFLSIDPAHGKPGVPISLARYIYAQSDPNDAKDPLGGMTLGEVSEGLDIQGVLGSMARDQVSNYVQERIFGGSDNVDGVPSLWDELLAMLVGSISTSISPSSASASVVSVTRNSNSLDGHHTVPIAMCGHPDQWLVYLPWGVHQKELHAELDAFEMMVNVAGIVLDRAFKRNKTPSQKSAVVRLGRTIVGRTAIANGLALFYTEFGWWDEGVSKGRQPFGAHTIGEIFPYEAARFIANHHSYPTCSR
jgi:RHS repeat-associated protein